MAEDGLKDTLATSSTAEWDSDPGSPSELSRSLIGRDFAIVEEEKEGRVHGLARGSRLEPWGADLGGIVGGLSPH